MSKLIKQTIFAFICICPFWVYSQLVGTHTITEIRWELSL
jgi:hypothetical protein